MNQDIQPEEIVSKHYAGVWRYLRFLGASKEHAEDLTQETFLAFFRASFSYKSPEETSAFLRTIARRTHIDLLVLQKKSKSQKLSFDVFEAELEAKHQENTWSNFVDAYGDFKHEDLGKCYQKLHQRAQEALRLRYEKTFAFEEVAKTLGIKLGAAKTLARRSLLKLRDCLEQRLS